MKFILSGLVLLILVILFDIQGTMDPTALSKFTHKIPRFTHNTILLPRRPVVSWYLASWRMELLRPRLCECFMRSHSL